MDCSAQAVMAGAVALNGIGDGLIDSVIVYLLCQWALSTGH